MVTSFVKICKRYAKVGRKEGKLHWKFVLTVTVHGPTHGDIKGEIIEQADRVSITEVCEALSIQKLWNCWKLMQVMLINIRKLKNYKSLHQTF